MRRREGKRRKEIKRRRNKRKIKEIKQTIPTCSGNPSLSSGILTKTCGGFPSGIPFPSFHSFSTKKKNKIKERKKRDEKKKGKEEERERRKNTDQVPRLEPQAQPQNQKLLFPC